jgi:catechol 2,3-dioxygenase-like lactoylglutathione lyase family enzyme
MLANSLAVTTLVVTDVDRARKFYADQLGLTLLEETPFTCRFGAGKGSQISIRRGQPPVSGPTVAHFEVDDIEAEVRDLTSRGSLSRTPRRQRPSTLWRETHPLPA